MSITASPGSAFPAGGEAKLPNLIFAVIKGAVAVFGISGVFYGAGFLALRSHFTSLGIWSAVPSNSSDIVAEGARFLYNLILLPADFISRLFNSTKLILPVAFLVLALAGFLWDRRGWLGRFDKKSASGQVGLGNKLYSKSPALLLIGCLAVTYILVNTGWAALDPNLPLLPEKQRSNIYDTVVLESFLALLLAWLLYRIAWPAAKRAERGLVLAQWLLVAASLITLPMTYGRLRLPNDYPVFSYAGASSDERLLIGETSSAWILWNNDSRQTEVLSKEKVGLVFIAAHRLPIRSSPAESRPAKTPGQ